MLTRIKYGDLLKQLDDTSTWLADKAQIRTHGTRFEQIYQNVQQIVKQFESGEIDALIQEKGNEELWFSLTESDAFIKIYSSLKNLKSSELPRQALKHIVGGPLLPRNETPETAQSRNVLFELELAARFKEVGIEVVGFDDIQLVFYGNHLWVQCKRPYSKKNVTANLKSAKDQIRKRQSVVGQGMIAFAIDKLYKTDRKIFVVDNEYDIAKNITKYTNAFIADHYHEWRRLLNTRIIAILICLKYVCHIRDINLLTTGFQFEIYDRGISDYESSMLHQIGVKFTGTISG